LPNSQELQAEIEKLDAQIADAKKAEYRSALYEVRKTIAAFGFTRADVFGRSTSANGGEREPRYRDPVSGAVWSGRGRRPQWLKGKDLSLFPMTR
jgi:DNA-binding protein H-NS